DARALAVSQDRLKEKSFLQKIGVAICPFAPVSSGAELDDAIQSIGLPAVLKTTRFGYDGKGQRIVRTSKEAYAALEALRGASGNNTTQLVLEAFVPFQREISLIVARNGNGEIAAYDPAENVHLNHILHTSTVPADISKQTAHNATKIASTIASSLDYCGVLGVEFFVSGNGQTQQLLVNEIAPRVHNSGHWTESVCPTSQFEQHIRAICNWPLGSTRRFADVVMENLVGEAVQTVPRELRPNDQPNIYGKSEIRAGRKMGHINRVLPSLNLGQDR
ncbi:MAG TPA: 5-(carboxyamino)imidazole ribonucleotide synthase, partial [Devosia sp.]|nr:5-(carboxyamino)imidazole ribonucleotide synthase [Devosia sp.]